MAFLIRFGTGVLPDAKTVIQASDQVYIAAVSGPCRRSGGGRGLPPRRTRADLARGGPLMKVAIAGAGAVGRSIARELIENGHEVTLIERNAEHIDVDAIPRRALASSATPAR